MWQRKKGKCRHFLQAVQKEYKDSGIKEQMKQYGQAFLNAWSVTAQEAAYRILGIPLHKSNFQSVWIPTGLPNERVGLVKSSRTLSNLEDDDEVVFVPGILVSCRSQQLELWLFALFASWYQVELDKQDKNDFQPNNLNVIYTPGAGIWPISRNWKFSIYNTCTSVFYNIQNEKNGQGSLSYVTINFQHIASLTLSIILNYCCSRHGEINRPISYKILALTLTATMPIRTYFKETEPTSRSMNSL